ncbi:hypothetical protein [Thermomonas brevis]
MQELEIHRFSIISIFKIVGIGLFFSLMPALAITGIACGLGLLSMHYNGQVLHGWWPVVMAPVFGLFFVTVLTAFVSICMILGLWVYSLIAPIVIVFRPAQD